MPLRALRNESRLYLLPSSLDSRCAIQKLILDLQRLLKGLSGSAATYRRPASEGKSQRDRDSASLPVSPPHSRPFPTALGDESFPSSATLTLLSATLFEPPAPLATPSILVSTSLNVSQPLGADIT
ncbi:hypothetical protein EV715DRAFT_298195 [Schizophyllum commune]